MKKLLIGLLTIGSFNSFASTCEEVNRFLIGESANHFEAQLQKNGVTSATKELLYLPNIEENLIPVFARESSNYAFYDVIELDKNGRYENLFGATLYQREDGCQLSHWKQYYS